MGNWDIVVMAKTIPTYKLKMSIREKVLSKTNIPVFQHSSIPCRWYNPDATKRLLNSINRRISET
jgi:hypothetical protein